MAAEKLNPIDAARITRAKRMLSMALRRGWVSEKTKAKMWLLAAKRPDLFGKWADIYGKAGDA